MELILNNESKTMEFTGNATDLLRQLKLRREEVVIKINGKLAPETTELKGTDRVEVIQVVFGG
jgi:thiamine biosynthesis protein ThiS